MVLPASAQTTGRIAGQVTDPSGALIVGAQVLAVSQGTAERRTASTDSLGNYAFPALRPGAYTLTVSAQGFRQGSFPDVHVAVTETTILNIRLQVGSHSEA
ncbi:MAG: carboxypeptidase-like regulatory domain-containing protein, partial [Nevskiales bacterium]